MPGLVARAFGGRYDPRVEQAIVNAMVEAAREAVSKLEPATLLVGVVDAPGFVRNRTRDATASYPLTDPFLDVIQFETAAGKRLTLLRYSAHSTVVGAGNLEYSAGYPGYLRMLAEQRFGGEAFFMAGAVGSMGPRVPEGAQNGADGFARAEALARALDAAVAERLELRPALPGTTGTMQPELSLQPGALGVVDLALRSPPIQLRVAHGLRVSPLFLAINGVNRRGRMTSILLGDLVIIGFPGDLSGEIGAELRAWGAARGLHVVPVSFAGAYQGYISPDAYYRELRNGESLAYETGIMSWTGPGQEEFFVSTAHAVVHALQSAAVAR